MARARSIKPGFFTHEILAELSPLHRILFAGLWCQADRRGILEDRPKYLKTVILPYDDCDVNAMLNDLAGKGFVLGYRVGDKRMLFVCAFPDHQNPHKDEKENKLPFHDSKEATITRGLVYTEETQCKPSAGTVQTPGNFGSDRALTFNLLPVTLNPEPVTCVAPEAPAASPPTHEAVDQLRDAWNELTQSPIPKWESTGDARKALAQRALKRRVLAEWREVFGRIGRSSRCRGENDMGGWIANVEWALRSGGQKGEPAQAVLDGVWDNRNTGPPVNPRKRIEPKSNWDDVEEGFQKEAM